VLDGGNIQVTQDAVLIARSRYEKRSESQGHFVLEFAMAIPLQFLYQNAKVQNQQVKVQT